MEEKYSKDKLVSILIQKAKELGRTPTKKYWKENIRSPHESTIRMKFGSWNNALIAAGLPINRPHIKESDVILDIIRVSNELGRPPSRKEYSRLGVSKVFNKEWNALLEKAGLKKNRGTTRDDIIRAIVNVSNDIQSIPTSVQFFNHNMGYSSSIFYRNFSSFSEAIELSRLSGDQFPACGWTKNSAIDALIEFYNDNNRTPVYADIEKRNSTLPSRVVIKKLFKSIRNARLQAGLPEPNMIPRKNTLKCNDGHLASSPVELMVDNFLFENSVIHDTQVYLCEDRQWTCDFKVGSLWIEVDGYNGSRFGHSKIQFQDKLNFYSENSMKFFICHPDIDGWQEKLLRAIHLLS